MKEIGNILKNIPEKIPEEIFETLCSSKNIRIERIISKGHVTKKNHWYNQDQNEWILLIKGGAKLRIKGRKIDIALRPGDYINIPAHIEHQVIWTEPSAATVWLALFY